MSFQPPVVDGLSLRVVVDSRYERFLPKASHPLVQVEHVGRIPGRPDMTLAADEFIRRFLLHVLPRGFHRIRHYGLLASARRKDHLERARRLLDVAPPPTDEPVDDAEPRPTCPCCGGTMIIIEVFERRYQPRAPPQLAVSSGTPAP